LLKIERGIILLIFLSITWYVDGQVGPGLYLTVKSVVRVRVLSSVVMELIAELTAKPSSRLLFRDASGCV
jgi:hypothetical protein